MPMKPFLILVLTLLVPASRGATIEDLMPAGPPSEALELAKAVIRTTFRVDGQYCYAEEKNAANAASHLCEFLRPHVTFERETVGETDQLNGVTELYTLKFTYAHRRSWDGSWSEWDGGDMLIGSAWVFERKNGAWITLPHPYLNLFVQDEDQLEAQIAESNGAPAVISPRKADRIFAALRLNGLSSGPYGPVATVNNAFVGVGGSVFVTIEAKEYKVVCTAIDGKFATFQIAGTAFVRKLKL